MQSVAPRLFQRGLGHGIPLEELGAGGSFLIWRVAGLGYRRKFFPWYSAISSDYGDINSVEVE